jgi:hypothetical protein
LYEKKQAAKEKKVKKGKKHTMCAVRQEQLLPFFWFLCIQDV